MTDWLPETITPKSDQLNADDLICGPITVTITDVKQGTREQPVVIEIEGYKGRPYKPSKSMRRVLIMAWGGQNAGRHWVGRKMTLFRNPAVKFGGEEVGGIQISHLSDIDGRQEYKLTVTRGKRAPFVVEPLTTLTADEKATVSQSTKDMTNAKTLDELNKVAAAFKRYSNHVRAELRSVYENRKAELSQ